MKSDTGMSVTWITKAKNNAPMKMDAQQESNTDGPTPDTHSGTAERGHPTRAEGAELDELARGYNVGISTIRRVTRAA